MSMAKKKEKLPLSKTHPKLAKEAVGWDPKEFTFGSAKKLNWKCPKKHIYEASINSRTNRKSGCPYCSNQKVLSGFNDLQKKYPQHAKFAHKFNPKSTLYGSNNVQKWICPSGHSWNEKVNWFIKRSPLCKTCAGLKLLSGFNDLKTKYPTIAAEALGWNPAKVLPNDQNKYNWECQNKHKWPASPSNRTSRKTGCPFCKKGNFLLGFNDLLTTHPDLSKEAYGWDPKEINKGSNLNLDWKCKKGHIFKAVVSKRTLRGDGCSFCSNRKLLLGFNDLQTVFPKIAKEADGWDPRKYTYVDQTNILNWSCETYKHTWTSSIQDRTENKRGCSTCNPSNSQSGRQSLLVSHPKIAKEANGWDPNLYSSGSSARKEWKCSFGHVYKAAVYSRALGTECSICKNKTLLKGFNDLQTKFPEIAKEAYGWDPSTVFPSTNTHKDWKCKLGHIYSDTPGHRTNRNNGCSYCSGHKVLIGFNDLLSVNPEIASQAFGWDPKTVTVGSNQMKKWRCLEGNSWNAVVSSRRISGCPTCAKYGFDPNVDAFLYFIEHLDLQMLQIGITNYIEDRLKVHKKGGWEIIEIRGPMDGHLTQQWETAILRMLKAKGADLSNKEIAGKFEGYSEAWSKSTFSVKSIKELMRLTEEFEDNV